MTFAMDNYVDVATRLQMAFKRWPELRIQETAREVIEMPDKSCFIRATVTIWRTPDDLIPVIATCCEPYPGRTPYTKLSENENAFTHCIGRAIAYLGIGANKSLASRDEIETAQARQPTRLAEVVPLRNDVEQPFESDGATAAILQNLALLLAQCGCHGVILGVIWWLAGGLELDGNGFTRLVDALRFR